MGRIAVEPLSKLCIQCGSEFHRRLRSSVHRFRQRLFCSPRCRYLAEKLPLQTCPECGTTFSPEREGRKFCSRACSSRSYNKKKPQARYKRITTPDGRRMLEHRYVMEQKLGRVLFPHETVHHKNGKKRDNEPDNLELWVRGQPAGQRLADLITFVVAHYRDMVVGELAT